MTPYEIEILLWLYYTPSKIEKPRNQFFHNIMDRFIKLGLVNKGPQPKLPAGDEYEKEYHGNYEALSVYVSALCNVPLPIQRWVVPTIKETE